MFVQVLFLSADNKNVQLYLETYDVLFYHNQTKTAVHGVKTLNEISKKKIIHPHFFSMKANNKLGMVPKIYK